MNAPTLGAVLLSKTVLENRELPPLSKYAAPPSAVAVFCLKRQLLNVTCPFDTRIAPPLGAVFSKNWERVTVIVELTKDAAPPIAEPVAVLRVKVQSV
jgi:hypothetical protein